MVELLASTASRYGTPWWGVAVTVLFLLAGFVLLVWGARR